MISNTDGTFVCVRPPGWIRPEQSSLADFLAWSERAERLGYDGVFVGDRMLAEASKDGSDVYAASMLDCTVVLAAMAARTTRLCLGPLVMVLPYRHPIQLAKTVASLDAASGGRLILGAGIGWNPKEFEALGIPIAERAARFEEAVEIARLLWTGQPVSYEGRFWSLENVRVTPRPVAVDGPPIWIASFSPGQALDWTDDLPPAAHRQLARVGRLADGWVPLIYSASAKRRLDPKVLAQAWDLVLASATDQGRTRDDIDFVFSDWGYVLDGPGAEQRCREALSRFFAGTWEDAQRTYTIGTREQIVERIRVHTAHIDRVDGYVFTPLSDEPEQLDLLAEVAAELRRDAPTPTR
jgi:probable F420-dependent oxidoreductase